MMSKQELIFLLIVFVAVFCCIWLAISFFSVDPVRKRLANLSADYTPEEYASDSDVMNKLVRVADPISKLSLPSEGWENSPLQRKFINAGWRDENAPKLYFAFKTILTFGLPALLYYSFVSQINPEQRILLLLIVLIGAAIGYYLPNIILNRVVDKRQLDIFETFPDSLDLLTICMEAGLSFDMALAKVANEIRIKSEVLSQELQLVMMEMRSGFTRERALRNLALRTGVADIDTLATMVIQSERFGTSIGDSLRVQSDNLRTKRRLIAEEAAAKISLKLLFPLIFFLFPCLFVAIMGPAALQIMETFKV
ncbi:MAG TPA: type II secretion system F family protein [Methylophilus sp.]